MRGLCSCHSLQQVCSGRPPEGTPVSVCEHVACRCFCWCHVLSILCQPRPSCYLFIVSVVPPVVPHYLPYLFSLCLRSCVGSSSYMSLVVVLLAVWPCFVSFLSLFNTSIKKKKNCANLAVLHLCPVCYP